MTKRPFFLAGLCCLGGMAVAFLFSPEAAGFYALGLLLLAFLRKSKRGLCLFLSLLCLLSAFSVENWQRRQAELLPLAGETVALRGYVTQRRNLEHGVLYTLEAEQVGTLSLYDPVGEGPGLGERVEAVARLSKSEGRGSGQVLQGTCLSLEGKGPAKGLYPAVLRLRARLLERLEQRFSGPARQLLAALLLGERAELSAPMEDLFDRAGALHLLTVSGFHVSLLIGGFYGLLCLLPLNRRQLALCTFPALLLLVLVEGLGPAVCRAAIMAALSYLALLTQRDYDGLSAWGLALCLVLLPRPELLGNWGFQFSFTAVLGILLLQPGIFRLLNRLPGLPKQESRGGCLLWRSLQILSYALGAQSLLLPLQLWYFGEINLAAPISSLWAALLLPGVLGFGVGALCLPGLLGRLSATLASLLGGLFCKGLQLLTRWDGRIYSGSWTLIAGILLFYALLLILYLGHATPGQKGRCLGSYVLALSFLLTSSALNGQGAVEGICCDGPLVLCREGQAVIVGSLESDAQRQEAELALHLLGAEQVDFLCLSSCGDNGHAARDFCQNVAPKLLFLSGEETALEPEAGQLLQPGEKIYFWENWSLTVTEGGFRLEDGARKILKIPEKYAIIGCQELSPDLIVGEEGLAWGNRALRWSRLPTGQLRFRVEKGMKA